ncbi:MAG: hypothetical protein H7172_14320 [Ferruginibacter sp.]|nr:hypothetical protein [Rhodoferax sp.]
MEVCKGRIAGGGNLTFHFTGLRNMSGNALSGPHEGSVFDTFTHNLQKRRFEMDEAGSNFSWFMVYLIGGVLLVAGVAAWVMVWERRKHKRERRAASRQIRARVQAWRNGTSTPSQQADLNHRKDL